MNKHKGFFLCLEGPDGAGKTTMRKHIEQWFADIGINCILTREPGGTPEAELVRERILMDRRPGTEPIKPIAKTMMFMTARALHLENMVWPNVEAGHLVISDRFCDSTFAYQSAEGVPVEKLRALHAVAFDGFQADLTIVLDGDPEAFRKRMVDNRGEAGMTYYDKKPMSFHVATREMYLENAKNYPERYAVIDAEQNEEQVMAQLIPHLMRIDQHMRKRPSE
jgi:dTMP kinase